MKTTQTERAFSAGGGSSCVRSYMMERVEVDRSIGLAILAIMASIGTIAAIYTLVCETLLLLAAHEGIYVGDLVTYTPTAIYYLSVLALLRLSSRVEKKINIMTGKLSD